MSNHHLIRTPDNEPVCSCGFRPDILDTAEPIGRMWKAKTHVLDHVASLDAQEAMDELNAGVRSVYSVRSMLPLNLRPERSPDAPFKVGSEAKYPRAGVRRMPSGKWLLSLWDGSEVIHVLDEPEFDDRKTAFDYGWLTIGACRQSGTNLNGWANA